MRGLHERGHVGRDLQRVGHGERRERQQRCKRDSGSQAPASARCERGDAGDADAHHHRSQRVGGEQIAAEPRVAAHRHDYDDRRPDEGGPRQHQHDHVAVVARASLAPGAHKTGARDHGRNRQEDVRRHRQHLPGQLNHGERRVRGRAGRVRDRVERGVGSVEGVARSEPVTAEPAERHD